MKPIIELNNVSIVYNKPSERIKSIKEYAIRRLQRKVTYDKFWALKDMSFEVYEGDVLGVIGRNGAGKSTLLKVIARVLKPTTGRIQIRGRVSPLLELGAGFDKELTGRENIYLNGAILGYKKPDITKRFERIVSFAGLEEFVDVPIRNYSSGMVARLGFSIATDVQPEILILDEVLSVGDAEFQNKSSERIKRYRENGTTVLLVTHSFDAIKAICNRAIWLKHGQLYGQGPVDEVVKNCEKEFKNG
jgi:ABC-type polysaccharide/polyol phosphate transport system ATPase subunit